MPYIKTDYGKIHYKIEGNGKPLIFIHGRTLDMRMWKPQIEHFRNNYQCISYDLDGFGKSAIPRTGYNRSETLKQLFKHLEIHRANVIALSLGVDVLINFVLQYPKYIKSMVLLSGAVSGWVYSDEFKSDWNKIVKKAERGDLNEAKKLWLNCKAFVSLKVNNAENYEILKQMIDDYSGWDLYKAPKHNRKIKNAIEELSKIKTPTLVITGKKDYSDFIENGRKMSRELENVKYVSLPNCGHMVNLEFPKKVNVLIEEFLLRY